MLPLLYAKPSPSKSIPPPATEEEKELVASPPCPPVPQVFGLDTAPNEIARKRRDQSFHVRGKPVDYLLSENQHIDNISA